MGAEGDSPLAFLTVKLRRGPPSLSSLVACLQSSEAYAQFLELIREYLPEYESEILAETSERGRIAAFTSRFADRYFPLAEMVEGYEYFVYSIPALVQGVSYDDYHDIASNWRPGYCLMTYLVEDPYEQEGRIALGEECLSYVSADHLQRVPEGGFSPPTLERLTQGSRYQALGHWARILWHDTGNFFLDVDYEQFGYELLPWDRETVESLTREWQQAERIQQMVFDFARWLEEDPPSHFEETINFLEEKMNGE